MNNAKVTLVGNLVRDVEVNHFNDNTMYSFCVAVDTSLKDENNKYKSNFYDCTLWGKQGEAFARRAQKGTQVWVNGDIMLAEFKKTNGEPGHSLHVNISDIRVISKGKEFKPETK